MLIGLVDELDDTQLLKHKTLNFEASVMGKVIEMLDKWVGFANRNDRAMDSFILWVVKTF